MPRLEVWNWILHLAKRKVTCERDDGYIDSSGKRAWATGLVSNWVKHGVQVKSEHLTVSPSDLGQTSSPNNPAVGGGSESPSSASPSSVGGNQAMP